MREARRKANINQIELAEASGISQPHLSLIEQGKIFPMGETRKRIEGALNVEVNWIETRLQGPRKLTFVPDGQSARENHVMAAIAEFVMPATGKEREEKFKFLRDFINQYESALEAKENETAKRRK